MGVPTRFTVEGAVNVERALVIVILVLLIVWLATEVL